MQGQTNMTSQRTRFLASGKVTKSITAIALAAAMVVPSTLPSQAAMNGPAGASPAWTIRHVTLTARAGISDAYETSLAQGARIWVLRCEGIWCRINAGNKTGWTHLSGLSFGQFARGPFSGPKFSQ